MHPVLGLFRRNEWATRELLRFCAGLPPEVLDRSDPDVYGSIAASFKHIVGAEMRYLSRLDGEPPGLDEEAPLALSDLDEPARACAQRWEALLRSDVDVDRVGQHHTRDGTQFRMAGWLGFVQAVHHGDDHRTQINTLLSRQGIEPPDLDGWAFGGQAHAPGEISTTAQKLLPRFFGHHLWATHRLLRWMLPLPDECGELTAPGTYGALVPTVRHLLVSDRMYLATLDALDWRSYLAAAPAFESLVDYGPEPVPSWLVGLQAIHHGNDHRTHVGTIGLANGLPGLDLDVWSYAEAEGAYSEG